MHFVFITPKFIPNEETGGAAIYNLSVIRRLLALGHQATVVHFDCLRHNPLYPTAAEDLRKAGVEVVSFSYPPVKPEPKRWLFTRMEDNLGTIRLVPQVTAYLEQLKPDLVFAYGDDALAAVNGLQGIPIAVQLGDPFHLIRLIRWLYDLFFSYPFGFNKKTLKLPLRIFNSSIENLPRLWVYPRLLEGLLKQASLVVTVCGQHAPRYTKMSGQPCYFTPVPLPDTIGPQWAEKRAAFPHYGEPGQTKAKILWVGKLRNTENRYALRFLVREVYPALVKELGAENFDLHLVGDSRDCPYDVAELAQKHSNVIIRGHVHDIDSEWLSADVYLVTNNTTVGARTRILSAFSGGNCVVAHAANLVGIPALKHGENALIGRNAKELAQWVHTALGDPALRERLGRQGRLVYEQIYQLDVAAQYLVDLFLQTLEKKNKA